MSGADSMSINMFIIHTPRMTGSPLVSFRPVPGALIMMQGWPEILALACALASFLSVQLRGIVSACAYPLGEGFP